MPIVKYSYKEIDGGSGWNMSVSSFEQFNLFVGLSGSGKSRLLATIQNLALMISRGELAKFGDWSIQIINKEKEYQYNLSIIMEDNHKFYVKTESLKYKTKHKPRWKTLFSRSSNRTTFKGKQYPNINKEITAINVFRDEKLIKPCYEFFTNFHKRDFDRDALDKCRGDGVFKYGAFENLEKKSNDEILKNIDPKWNLNLQLYVLKKYFTEKYEQIVDNFINIFPFIEEFNLEIVDLSSTDFSPVFKVKEIDVSKEIHTQALSSGMLKTLMIMTEIITINKNAVYMLDEYENSLGINAINFLPDYIDEFGSEKQFIVTTHHPSLINKVKIEDWRVVSRHGQDVTVYDGKKLKQRYGKSKHTHYTQLINDSIYSGS